MGIPEIREMRPNTSNDQDVPRPCNKVQNYMVSTLVVMNDSGLGVRRDTVMLSIYEREGSDPYGRIGAAHGRFRRFGVAETVGRRRAAK